jgi:hypothetical protein
LKLSEKVAFLEYCQGAIKEHDLDDGLAKAIRKSLDISFAELSEAEDNFYTHPDSKREIDYFEYAHDLVIDLMADKNGGS